MLRMSNWRTRSLAFPILVVALLALLLLAVLQFIWIGQLSQSARERMQASASEGASQFSANFDRELVRAYLDLQMDATALRDRRWDVYQQRYNNWQLSARYPELVKDIYVAQISRNGTLALYAFDPERGTIAPRTWTSDFASILQSLDSTYRTRRIEGDLVVGNSPAPIDEYLPALVIPIARPWLLNAPAGETTDLIDADIVIGGGVFNRSRRPCVNCDSEGPLFAYTIVTLNQSALEEQIIPDLAQRYLGGGLNDYYVTIVSRRTPSMLIYQSDADAPPGSMPADATANLLALRLDEFNRLLVEAGRELPTDDERRLRIAIGVVDAEGASASQTTGWQLRLNHKAGSLENAVANLRLRNLAISFGTILFLGVALAMIVISTRRVQRLARAKVEFVAAISHELRTPLSVICSAGSNLADGVVSDPERTQQYGALIMREGRRLSEMVEQTMAFAGAQSERRHVERRLISPREVVERALAASRSLIEEQGVILDYQIAADIPMVQADVEALQRAVHNLIVNALKYGAHGKWLRVTINAEGGERRKMVLISVADHGPGIHSSEVAQVFEPFYRGRDAIDHQIPGSGLGLSLVKMIAEAHGGRVSVATQNGIGSVFTLHIPAVVHPHAMPHHAPEGQKAEL
jgi:two-component system, OmpR family, sensor histidine kinase SenX3